VILQQHLEWEISNVEKLTVNFIDYHEIQKLVYDNFGIGNTGNKYHHAYEFCAVQKCGNDSVHLFAGVIDAIDDEDYYEKSICQFLKDGTPGELTNYEVLCLLCRRDLIPAGDYLVHVCW